MLLLLILASFIAATLSGAAGMGGALVLLPVLNLTVGAKAAVPILTVAQLIGNLSRAYFGRDEINWRSVLLFSVTAVPASLAGSVLFANMAPATIKTAAAAALIGVILLRRTGFVKLEIGEKGLAVGGVITGLVSGAIGSAGPLGAASFLGLGLPAGAYVASEALGATAIHIAKTVAYQRYQLIGVPELTTGLMMGGGMICGSWVGRQLIKRLSQQAFVRIVEALLFVSALHMLFSG
jgi:hypothetical protein